MINKIKQSIFGPKWEVYLKITWPDNVWIKSRVFVRAKTPEIAVINTIKKKHTEYMKGWWNKIEVLSIEKVVEG